MNNEMWEQFDTKALLDKVIIKKVKDEFFLIGEGRVERKIAGPFPTADAAALHFIAPTPVVMEAKKEMVIA